MVKAHGGISFIIVKFCTNNSCYLLEIDKIIDFIQKQEKKSIPIEYFENSGHKIRESYLPRLDYLKVLDKLYFK